MRWASDIEMKAITWMWRKRFARGYLHLIAGDPDEGKSLVTCGLTACVTTGKAWPGGAPGSGKGEVVAILSAEDGADTTIKPRLVAAGADLTKVAIHDVSESSSLSLVDDLAALERTLAARGATTLIVDSLNDYVPRVSTSTANAMKEVLQALARMAHRLNLVVIVITHFNKDEEKSAKYRVLDSVAITATCRSIFYVAPDPEIKGGHLFAHGKHNLGRKARTLGYRIIGKSVTCDDGQVANIGHLKWYVPNGRDIDVDALLRPSLRPRATAEKIIREQLKSGPVLSTQILRAVKKAGVSKETAYAVKRALDVDSRQFAKPKRWFWFPLDWPEAQVKAWSPPAKKQGVQP